MVKIKTTHNKAYNDHAPYAGARRICETVIDKQKIKWKNTNSYWLVQFL